MCPGIPGEFVEPVSDQEEFALVNVAGAKRVINIGMLENQRLAPGDWVLIHLGFAFSKSDQHEAAQILRMLSAMGTAYTDELSALAECDLAC